MGDLDLSRVNLSALGGFDNSEHETAAVQLLPFDPDLLGFYLFLLRKLDP
jgi:hypothetical protein